MQTKVVTASTAAGRPASVLAQELAAGLGGVQAELVTVFASPKQDLGALVRATRRALPEAVILGCTTAGEFTEKADTEGGSSALALAGDFRVFAGMGRGLSSDPLAAVHGAVADIPRQLEGYPHKTALLLLDPLAGNGEHVANLASAALPADVKLAGGAAGDDLAMERTYVACGSLVEHDALAIAVIFSKKPLGVGVCHGHTPLSDPLRVTRADGNVVYEINGRPAWEIWKEETRAAASQVGINVDQLADAEVGGFLLRYELGLTLREGYKVRAPLSCRADGGLGFASSVAEGAVFRITQSSPAAQIESARSAAASARLQLGRASVSGALVFDCICRKLILGDRFHEAVTGISDKLGGVRLAGLGTYGEIALNAGGLPGFHNTTTVVVAFQ